MPQPRVLILRAPGTNCDAETAYAFEMAGGSPTVLHVNQILASPETLNQFQIVCFPGGFSYGDDLSAGQILALQIKTRLWDRLVDFPRQQKLVLGICNGFQILIKTGLLFPADDVGFPATLTWNTSGRYTDRWVNLVPSHLYQSQLVGAGSGSSGTTEFEQPRVDCVFLRNVERLYLPIAHGEGRFVSRDSAHLERQESQGQLALRYQPSGDEGNPNGSVADVAGVCDLTGHIFGLMPHPERHIHATQHPRWTREGLAEYPDGRYLFDNAVAYFA